MIPSGGKVLERLNETLGSRRSSLFATGMGVVTVALLLLPAGSGGAGVVPALPIRPPYAGSSFIASSSVYTTGCANAHVGNASHWSSTTGLGGFNIRVSGHSCSPAVGGSAGLVQSEIFESMLVEIPLPSPLGGGHKVVAHWALHPAAHENLTPGTCANSSATSYNCDQQSYWNVGGGAYVIDLTTWATTYNSNFWGGVTNTTTNYTGCSSGSCTSYGYTVQYGRIGPATFFINGSFNRTHHYAVVTYINAQILVYLSAFQTYLTGASGNASVVMSTSTRYADLLGITLT